MEHRKNNELVRIIYHPDYLADYSTASCECPDRVRAIMSDVANVFAVVEPDPCSEEDILLCHSEGVLQTEKTNPGRFEIARRAAGGAIMAASLAMQGFIPFAVIRPPGHHANPDHNRGFCFFNNMAIALSKHLSEGAIRSAVVLDIDLHFGDGTDIIFRGNPGVRVLNIQSSNPEDFLRETREALESAGSADILGISAGFDQYIRDWGANLSMDDYEKIGRLAGQYAREHTSGRMFALLEGGYYIPDLGKNVLSLLRGACSTCR